MMNWMNLGLEPAHAHWLWLGWAMSLQLLAASWCLALPLALGLAVLRLAPWAPARWLGTVVVEGVRNVPLLAHLLFWYFAAPEALPDEAKAWLYDGRAEFVCATIALGLYAAAYMSEDVRSGIRAVRRGQWDASKALGLGYVATMRWVILPQALRVTVPPLVSQTLNLWKDSSLATVVGVGELMYQAARVETTTFRSAEAFAFATLAYLTISLLITALGRQLALRLPVRTA